MPQHDEEDRKVQHVFHSGWNTKGEGAIKNVEELRGHMSQDGMDTTPDQWTVYSDPRKWQVLKEKFPRMGTKPPTAKQAGKQMARNTLDKTTTVWHGHSQGGAQITQAGKYALKKLSKNEHIREKMEERLSEMTDEEKVEMLRGELGRKRTNHYKDEKHHQMLLDHLSKQRAQEKLSKYNAFSYSGAAMYPPEWAEHATFSHMRGDPVSGWVVDIGKGEWKEGEGREMEIMGKDSRNLFNQKALQLNIGSHKYGTNYSEKDSEHTRFMLDNMGLLPEQDTEESVTEDSSMEEIVKAPLEELDRETTPGLRTGDDTKITKAMGDGLVRGGKFLGGKAKRGGKKLGKGLKKGAKGVGKGLKKGAKGVGKGLKTLGEGIGDGLVETGKTLMPMMGMLGGGLFEGMF